MKKYIGQHIFDYVASFRQNVGIGTDTPSYKLDVVGKIQTSDRLISNQLQARSTFGMVFKNSSGSDLMFMSNTGNFGIGLTNPTEKLHVSGNALASNLISSGYIKLGADNQILSDGSIFIDIDYNNNQTDRVFKVRKDNSTDLFTINEDASATFAGDVTVSGNLTVSGTTTTINTTNLNVEDKNITLNYSTGDSTSTADGAGITIQDAVDSSTDATILWNATTDTFNFSHGVRVPDNVKIQAGTGGDLDIFHTGSATTIDNATGHLTIQNSADDSDIIFKSDDGSGNLATYITLDGGFSSPQIKVPDNVQMNFGDGLDLRIIHDGFDSYISSNGTGHLYIRQLNDDKDIIFQCDNGSGGLTNYLKLDGANTNIQVSKNLYAFDNVKIAAGDSLDLQIYHSGADSHIDNYTSHLKIQQLADDMDIKFLCDDGSGGTVEYMRIDGGDERIVFSKDVKLQDNDILRFGNANDLKIQHNGTDSIIANDAGGDLKIQQNVDDGDMLFQCDDGSGGTTNYFHLDGGMQVVQYSKNLYLTDNIQIRAGSGSDMRIYHNGSHSYIENHTGNLAITNTTDDGDIIFSSDDGSGGTTEYFRLDGSLAGSSVYTVWPDNSIAAFGSSADLRIEHTGSTASIFNTTGHLQIINYADDSDIIFRTDDGSGGDTEYMRLDGGTETVEVAKATNFASTVTASSYKISAATVLSGSTNVTLGSAGATGTISLTTHGGTPFRIDDNDRIIITRDGGHTSGNISASQSTVDIFNPHTNDTDEKGSILTFSDNYFDSGGAQKTIRAAIKGGTDTTGNTGDGFLAFYTDSSTANSATERARINKDGNFSVHSTEQSYATGTSTSGAVDGLTGAINTLGGLSVKRGGFFGGSLFVKGMSQTSRAIEVRPSTTGNGSTFFPAMIGRNNDNGTANYLLVGGDEWAFGLYDGNQSGGTPVDQSHMIRFKAGTASNSQPRVFVGDSGSNTTNSYIEVAGHKVGTTKAVVLLHGSDGVVGNSGSNGSDSHTWTITHGMGSSRNYKVEIIQNSGNYDTVHADITRPSDTTIVVTFSAAVANSAYKALILKCG